MSSKGNNRKNNNPIKHKVTTYTTFVQNKAMPINIEKDISYDIANEEQELIELTSIYEVDQESNFGGLSLFYFLIYSGLSAFLPYLSIVLNHHGFQWSQIGAIYSASFIVSCTISSIWSFITNRYNNKQNIMLMSVASWIIFFVPMFVIKVQESKKEECLTMNIHNTSLQLNSSKVKDNFTKIQVIAQRNTTTTFISGLDLWKTMDYVIIMYILLFVIGRIFQSATDYFYFDHNRLLYPEPRMKRHKTSYHISTKVVAALITVFIGYVLDSVFYCDPNLGHYQVAFYVFIVFTAFAMFVLYFLDMDQFEKPNLSADKQELKRRNGIPSFYFPAIFKIVTLFCLVTAGASRGVFYAFLQLRLHSIDSLYLQIGAVFAVHKIAETLIKLYRCKICTNNIGMFEILLVILCIEAVKNLIYSYVTTPFLVWIIIPVEIFSGFPALLFLNNTPESDRLEYFKLNSVISDTLFFVFYWCIGFSFGPIIFGFFSDLHSNVYAFRGLSLVNLFSALLLSLTYCLFSVQQKRKDASDDELAKCLTTSEEEEVGVDFLMEKDLHEEDDEEKTKESEDFGIEKKEK